MDFALGELEGEDVRMKNTMTKAWVEFIKLGEFSNLNAWEPVNTASELQHNYWDISGPNPSMSYNAEIEARMFIWEFVMNGPGTTTPAPATTRSASNKLQIGLTMLVVSVTLCLSFYLDI